MGRPPRERPQRGTIDVHGDSHRPVRQIQQIKGWVASAT